MQKKYEKDNGLAPIHAGPKPDKNIPEEIEHLLQEFTRSFEDYGIGHLATQAEDIIKEQLFEHKTLKIGYPYYIARGTTKKLWNMQVFKKNYYAWLKRFTDTLSRIDQKQYPWIDKREILEPFLKIKWDEVQISASFLELVKERY